MNVTKPTSYDDNTFQFIVRQFCERKINIHAISEQKSNQFDIDRIVSKTEKYKLTRTLQLCFPFQ